MLHALARAAVPALAPCETPLTLSAIGPCPFPAISSGQSFVRNSPSGWAFDTNYAGYAFQLVPGTASTVVATCRLNQKACFSRLAASTATGAHRPIAPLSCQRGGASMHPCIP